MVDVKDSIDAVIRSKLATIPYATRGSATRYGFHIRVDPDHNIESVKTAISNALEATLKQEQPVAWTSVDVAAKPPIDGESSRNFVAWVYLIERPHARV